MVHGHNEGHIAPYTDSEFQLTEYHNVYEMLWYNIITDVRNNCNAIDNDKTCKTDGIKNNISQDKTKFVL